MQRKLLIVACLLTSTFTGYSQNHERDRPEKALITTEEASYKEIGAPLPSLRIYRRDGAYLSEQDFKKNIPLIIMLFNPTCEHCEEQTKLFEKNIDLFKNTNLVLLAAPGMEPYLSYFVNNTGANDFPALQIGVDSGGYIRKTFRYESLPQINVYDENRKLMKVFTGITPIDSLKAYLR